MHELAVASELLDRLLALAVEHQASLVSEAHLRLGAASCLSPASLQFGFDSLAAGTAAAGCRLRFERVPATGSCVSCAWRGEIPDLEDLKCRRCGASPVTIAGGSELTLEAFTVE